MYSDELQRKDFVYTTNKALFRPRHAAKPVVFQSDPPHNSLPESIVQHKGVGDCTQQTSLYRGPSFSFTTSLSYSGTVKLDTLHLDHGIFNPDYSDIGNSDLYPPSCCFLR